MSSEITYTDDEGFTSFSNGLPAPGDRFNGWTPMSPVGGVEAEALGTGELFVYKFRDDYGASFTITEIPQANVAAALRLIRWLNNGGEVTVVTGDAESNEYTCKKWKGSDPSLSAPDSKTLRRTLKLTLKSLTETEMVVVWP